MTELFALFFTWQFLLLCVGISAIWFVIRTLVESLILENPHLPGSKTAKIWQDVIVLIGPVILGMIFPIFAKKFVYPVELTDNYSKFLFAASAGLAAPTIYRVMRAYLWSQTGQQAQLPNVTSVANITNNVVIPVNPITSDDIVPPELKV